MKHIDVIAVLGTCAPERHLYAQQLAVATSHIHIPAERLSLSKNPSQEAAMLAPWTNISDGAVVELPSDASTTALIDALGQENTKTQLSAVLCVVDAMHVMDDLATDDYVPAVYDAEGNATVYAARALLTVTQMEYASTIVLMNWENLDTQDLSTLMSLVRHLAPLADLRLHQPDAATPLTREPYYPTQLRTGWASLLNGTAQPGLTDPQVSAFRYTNPRPLHPERLKRTLDEQIESEDHGFVVRSAGFCRFATEPMTTIRWDHVCHTIAFHDVAVNENIKTASDTEGAGQDLAIIGLDLDHDALAEALDQAVLTHEEFAAGPEWWSTLPNPFPAWAPNPTL